MMSIWFRAQTRSKSKVKEKTSNRTTGSRQAKRNERLYKKTHLIGKIEGHVSLREKAQKLREELNGIKDKLIDLNSQYSQKVAKSENMRKKIEQKDEDINKLIRKVKILNSDKEDSNNKIESLKTEIAKLKNNIGILRNSLRIANCERIQTATKINDAKVKEDYLERKYNTLVEQHQSELRTRDDRETNLYSQIELLQNRVEDLKTWLGISTKSYSIVTNENSRNTIIIDDSE
ncbi:hypothetical protein F8M41_020913 [Gigaspora margarita]|uniref:Uncharacterized protein n=1 Tax=Gigaspora margarita TaxID=4874 RepID=A0A8H4EJB9_GIGMA|nr:hypothetical protein F8M41_020913 [Gigaspora margarita]